jgi:cyclophilin family peptidyl-prolyl cis-trans isomerase
VSKAEKRERQRENRERAREERERLQRRDKQMKTFRSLLIVLVPIMIILVIFTLTSNSGDDNKAKAKTDSSITRSYPSPPPMTIDPNATYTATMDTSEGTITMALDAKTAPVATNNFVFLARNRFYDGLTFHRASKDFVIQGGDPKGDGSGGPGYTVTGEVPTDHYPVGALAAAKTGSDPAGTFGSQFFIVTGANGATLPNDYARFGSVTKGLGVAKKIEGFAPSSGDGTPTKKVTIKKVTITSGGKTLPPSTVATSTTTKAATSSTT